MSGLPGPGTCRHSEPDDIVEKKQLGSTHRSRPASPGAPGWRFGNPVYYDNPDKIVRLPCVQDLHVKICKRGISIKTREDCEGLWPNLLMQYGQFTMRSGMT